MANVKMIVNCPECNTRYNLTPKQVGPKGRTVRCVRCQYEWFQDPIPDAAAQAATPAAPKAPIAPENPQTGSSLDNDLMAARDKLKRRAMYSGAAAAVILSLSFSTFVLVREMLTEKVPETQGVYHAIGLHEGKKDGTAMHPRTGEITEASSTGLIIPQNSIERTLSEDGSLTTLSYSGKVINTNKVDVLVPEIRVSLFDGRGVELDFWPAQLSTKKLAPGEEATWVCRFFNPPLAKISEHRIAFHQPTQDEAH